MDTQLQQQLADWLSDRTQVPFNLKCVSAAHGGCIHQAYVLEGEDRSFFIKLNRAAQLEVFQTEAAGLDAIARSAAIRVPRPVGSDIIGSHSFLAMEWLQFGSAGGENWQKMAQQLAALHRCSAEKFGWAQDNYIGASPQSNAPTASWSEFFRERRLGPQLAMAQRAGIHLKNGEHLLEAAATLLDGHQPTPALVHGDLWSGNAGFLSNGTPVLYDPACYYGDRETDIAFSEFFGGFPATFYQAYLSAWPLPVGHERRKELYNLYHVLNHANLFGGGYVRQAQQIIDALIL